MSEIKRLLNSLLWEIYGRIPSSIARKHSRSRQMKMHPRLYEPRLLEKLSIHVLADICKILKVEIRLISKYLERVLISRDKNRTQQTILYGFLDVIVSSRLGESSREMRFNLSPPPGVALKGRGDAGRPIITDETNSSSDFNQWLHAMKMVARLPGGMPPEFRRKLWLALAEKYLKSKNVDWEKEEIKCFSEQWREDDEELGIQIVKDLHRTGSSLCSGPAGTINQAKLKRILLGYARYNPEVGYCQGFNMLGALILQVMDKEEIESIKVMIYLVEGILPRGYFSGSLGGLQADMAVFRELMTCKLPRLAKHLQKLQGPVENAFEPPLTNVFTMQWFLTMFCTCLPMTCVLRVWDLVLIEGSDVLLRTALVLWSLLEERILNARTADDFYCKMGSFSSELLNGHLIDSNGLIEKVVDLGPIPELQKLRDKHLYNISPFRDKTGLQLYYSDEEGDSDEDSRMAVATAWGLRLNRRGSAGLSNKTDSKDRIALDISLLKKQYDRLRERQRQAHIILTSAVARQGSNPNQSSIQMNQLLIGRNAIVTNNGRRLGPPQGAIPPARKPSLPTAKSPKPTQTKTLRRGETLHWRDTDLSKRRRGSLKWKDIKSDSSQSGQDDRPAQLIESAPSSRSSSSEPKSQRGSVKAHQRSDSSSYSEDSDGNSSTSTSLCDEDDHEVGNVSSLEGSPMKKSKKKHSEVPHKKCLEDVLNSNDKQHSVDSQIPFIQLTTMDSPVLNANKTDIDSIEYGKEDSETESNRLDYAGFVDEYSWPDMNEATSSGPLEDIIVDVTSNEGDFLSLSNVITSTSQLSPIPDITTYINNSNISPLRTPISAFDYANLVVSIDDSKKFDVNDEGVTNEYFERVNIVERPTKLDLLYSLNEEDSIRNAYKMPSCQSSPELDLHEEDSRKQNPSPEASKFLTFDKSTKPLPPSTEELDRKMKVLLEYSNQSSLSFIAEAKHEISSGIFKEREFDAKSLKYQPSALVPSNRASADIKPAKDETIEHLFVIPSVEKRIELVSTGADKDLNLEVKPDKILRHESKIDVDKKEEAISNVDQEDAKSNKYLTRTADNFKLSPEHGASEVEKELGNQFESSEKWFGDAVSHIPSTEDLETRFKALEMSFTDRKGPSAGAKIAGMGPEPADKSWEEKVSSALKSEVISTEPSSVVTYLPEVPKSHIIDTNLVVPDTSSPAKEQKEGSITLPMEKDHEPLLHSKYQTVVEHTTRLDKPLYCENQKTLEGTKSETAHGQVSNLDKPVYGGSQTILHGESKGEYTFSEKQPVSNEKALGKLVREQAYDLDSQQYSLDQDRSIILPAECESSVDCDVTSYSQKKSEEDYSLETSVIETTSNKIKSVEDIDSAKMGSESQLVKGFSLENSLVKQNSGREIFTIQTTRDVSEVDENISEKMDFKSQSNKEFSLEKQNSGAEMFTIDSIKDVSEVDQNSFDQVNSQRDLQEHIVKDDVIQKISENAEDKIDLESKHETLVKEDASDLTYGDNLPTHPLSYAQDHFGDKVGSQVQLKIAINVQSPSLLCNQSNMSDETEKSGLEAAYRLKSKIQNSDAKNLCSDDYSLNHPKFEGLGHDEHLNKLTRNEGTVNKEQLNIDSIGIEKPHPSCLSLSEDQFGENTTTQPVLEMVGFEELDKDRDSLYPTIEQKHTILETHAEKSENLETNTDPAKGRDSSKTKIDESDTVEDKHPQKPKIPSTEDLETRFMALERQLSEKFIPVIVDQSDNKDKLPKNEPALNIDNTPSVKVEDLNSKVQEAPPTKATVDPHLEVVTTKPIPSTADLEHRFRELERKLSSKSINSSLKTTAPQEDHMKALQQSNIVTNPSIVLPNNENRIPSNTPSSINTVSKGPEDLITHDQPAFIRKRIPSTEDLESRFQALEIQKTLKSPTAPTSNLLSPAKPKTEFAMSIPEVDTGLKRKSDIPSTEDLENRFQALEQSKLVQKPLKEAQTESQCDSPIPSTKDLETRFQALEQQKSIADSCSKIRESETQITDDPKHEKESKIVPSALDLELRFQALEQQKLDSANATTKAILSENESQVSSDLKTTGESNKKDQGNKMVPSIEDLETRYEALEQQKSIKDNCTKSKDIRSSSNSKVSKEVLEKKELPSAEDLESRFEALEQRKSLNGARTKSKEIETKTSLETLSNNLDKEEDSKKATLENAIGVTDANISQKKVNEEKSISMSCDEQRDRKLPSTQDLETRFEALEQKKSIKDDCTKSKESQCISDSTTSYFSETKQNDKNISLTPDSKPKCDDVEQQTSTADVCTKAKDSHDDLQSKCSNKSSEENEKLKMESISLSLFSEEKVVKQSKVPSTQDLETRFEALEQQKSTTSTDSKLQIVSNQERKKLSKVPSTHDLEKRFEDMQIDAKKTELKESKVEQKQMSSTEPTDHLKRKDLYKLESKTVEHQKSTNDDSSTSTDSKFQIASNQEHKKFSKVPSTHDLEKRFEDMQIDAKKTELNELKVEQKQELAQSSSTEPTDQQKRKELYKLESQSDETLTATDQTSTEFDTKTESRPTSCPEYSEPFDSNIVTTDRVLKIIEENSKILHRILKKTLADAGENTDTTIQSKKPSPGITDSLLALGNIFPRSDDTISPSRIKSHSWIRPSITLRSDDNISDRLASIKSTIKSIDTLCEEKSFRKEKCQRYIDSLFPRPTIKTTTPAINPSIKVDDFECKTSQERIPKRELKKDISPRRRRVEDREEYESRVRRDMMPNSLDTSSDHSFSLANIEQVDSEVDRINQEKQVDTQMERPLSPYYVSGYDLNKRSITPVVYIPTKLEIRHTTVTSTFYDRYLTEKHIERTFPRSKKSPVSPTITKSYLDISNYSSINLSDRSSKSAENSPSRRKNGGGLSPNETLSSATNKCNLISALEVTKKDLHIRSCDNILLQLRSTTNNKDIVPSIMVYNPLPTKIRKPPELGISLGLYKDYGSDESSKS